MFYDCYNITRIVFNTNKEVISSMMMVPSVAGIYAAYYVINNINLEEDELLRLQKELQEKVGSVLK